MKLLLGGSPCTHWSIAQTKARETKPEGQGWELFKNYLIARDKYAPDYFLYENNKSMAPAIRAQITRELGVEPILINSALVSAQSRWRLYWTNIPGVQQPIDRGIVLRDILEHGMPLREKGYTLDANYYKGGSVPFEHQSGKRLLAAEPVNITAEGKSHCLRASCYKDGIRNMVGNEIDRKTCIAIPISPIRIGSIECGGDPDAQGYRVYSSEGKSKTLCGNGGGTGAKTGLYTIPAMRVPEATKQGFCDIAPGECVDLSMEHSKTRRGRRMAEKSNCLTTSCSMYEYCGTIDYPIYRVENNHITIHGKQYPIKLRDGYYIIRKLTVRECMRLQTVPEWYTFPVSNTQAYKMLGNGWTVDVIVHILSYCPGIASEPLEVLSMYDGMSCGHIALDKLEGHIVRYYATEIDKYAIQTTQENYPETIQLGDAFQVRDDEWTLPPAA